jgi:Kelch motif.
MFGGFYLSGYINNLTKLENGKCSTINDNILSPPARMFHSLVVINGNIYLFGGRGLTENLDDL